MNDVNLRFAGSGGQGVILASVILAGAALAAGKNVAQSQSYGPEARGGSCKAEVIVSDQEIGFTKVVHPTFFMALTQEALETFAGGMGENCIVLIDDTLRAPEHMPCKRLVALPILRTASEKVGKAYTANIVAVGAINELLGLVDDECLKKSVLANVPAGTGELNMLALQSGIELVRK